MSRAEAAADGWFHGPPYAVCEVVFERAMIRERTSAGLAAASAEGRIGGRRKKLDAGKRREIAESILSGRKSGAEMARLYNVCPPTVSRIVAQHRAAPQ
ncbi:MAG: hypothetical protein ACREF0_16075 [Acetobacteraceae bacterium]